MIRNANRATCALLCAGLATLFLLSWSDAAPAAAKPSSASGITGVVNVNTASAAELQILPGVGESRARAIVEHRKRSGGFKDVSELTEVKGIGDLMLERLRPHLAISGKTTAQNR